MLCSYWRRSAARTLRGSGAGQVILRLIADGSGLRQGLQRHGWRALLLSLTLVFPVVHYVLYRLNWHPGMYVTGGITWKQTIGMLLAWREQCSFDLMAPGLIVAAVALCLGCVGTVSSGQFGRLFVPDGCHPDRLPHHLAVLPPCMSAGLALLVFGVGINLPFGGVAGRYTMPCRAPIC